MIVHILQFDAKSIHMKWNFMVYLNVINNETRVTISNQTDACKIVCMEDELHSSFVLYYKYSNNKNEFHIYEPHITITKCM